MAKTKILILDLDGTTRCPPTLEDKPKPIVNPFEQVVMPHAVNALRGSAIAFDQIVGLTNQGGCHQYKSLGETLLEQEFSLRLTQAYAQNFACIYAALGAEGKAYSLTMKFNDPHRSIISSEVVDGEWAKKELEHDFGGGLTHKYRSFRKPDAGLWPIIARSWGGIDDVDYLMVGDRLTDAQFAQAVGIPYLEAHNWWKEYAMLTI